MLLQQFLEIIQTKEHINENSLFRKVLTLWNTSRRGGKHTNYLKDVVDESSQLSAYKATKPFNGMQRSCYRAWIIIVIIERKSG